MTKEFTPDFLESLMKDKEDNMFRDWDFSSKEDMQFELSRDLILLQTISFEVMNFI